MFTKQTEYSIRALVYIAVQNGNRVRPGFREIAKETGSPEHYMAKILQNMTRHQIIASARGRGGGFFFPKPEQELLLYDVIKITEGEGFFTNCGLGLNECDDSNPCPIHDQYTSIREKLLHFLKTESIQALAGKINDHKAVLNRIL